MKKAKLIGALLAAVIAAAPAAGLAGNVLSFNDNAIVAEAAKATPPRYYEITKNNEYFGSNFADPILKNGDYKLYFRNGYLVITKTIYVSQYGYVDVNYRTFETGGTLLAMQEDGNLVTYNKSFSNPTALSMTYDSSKMTKHGYSYRFALSDTGVFTIQRITPVGNKYTIWNSTTGKMYRIG